jgi:hypothetical protein
MKILVKERGSNANGGQDFLICWFKQIKLHIFFYFFLFFVFWWTTFCGEKATTTFVKTQKNFSLKKKTSKIVVATIFGYLRTMFLLN